MGLIEPLRIRYIIFNLIYNHNYLLSYDYITVNKQLHKISVQYKWRRVVVVINTVQLHSTKPELNSGSAQVQILLVTCRRFEMVRISENGHGWK